MEYETFQLIHPAIAHFAISLPIISLILGLAYLYKPSELMSKLSTRFMVAATVFIIAVFFSGKEDASHVFSSLSPEGQEALKEHASLALYIVFTMVLATLVKFVGCFKKIFTLEIIAIILVAIVSVGVLHQGKTGGVVTYSHGAHVTNHADGLTCIDDPEFYMEMMAE